jgi:hypothetical protein
MRINVYGEEITSETELVTKTVTDDKFGTRTFYGLRFYLKSAPELHADPADDDRSAITLWLRWTRKDGHDSQTMTDLLTGLTGCLIAAVMAEGDDPPAKPAPKLPGPYKAQV